MSAICPPSATVASKAVGNSRILRIAIGVDCVVVPSDIQRSYAKIFNKRIEVKPSHFPIPPFRNLILISATYHRESLLQHKNQPMATMLHG